MSKKIVVSNCTEHLFKKQSFKVGDRVKVVPGVWQKHASYLDFLDEYIRETGVVEEIHRYSYAVRIPLDGDDETVYNFHQKLWSLYHETYLLSSWYGLICSWRILCNSSFYFYRSSYLWLPWLLPLVVCYK